MKLNIGQKGLLLVALPLASQFVFVAICILAVFENIQKLNEENHARSVMTCLNTIRRFVEEGVSDLANFKRYRKDPKTQAKFLQHYDSLVETVPKELRKLKAVVKNNPDELILARNIEEIAKEALSVLVECREKMFEENQFIAFSEMPRMFHVAEKVKLNIDKLASKYESLDLEIPSAQKDRARRLFYYLACGFLVNAGLTILIARYFGAGIVSRLKVLQDNSLRLAKGEELLPEVGGADEIGAVDLAFRDMSRQLKQAQREQSSLMAAALASEERTKSLIENMPLGLLVIDQENKIEMLNPRAEQLFAARSEELHLKPLGAILQEKTALKSSGRTNEFQRGAPATLSRTLGSDAIGMRDGETFPAEVVVSKFSTDQGKRFLLAVQDVTEKQEMERMKQEFVSMVSHDLRTPLTAVQGTLELLHEDTYGELSLQGHKRVEVAIESLDRLINLVNDLLDLEKMEAGKMRLNLKTCQLSRIIDASCQAVLPFAESAQVLLAYDSGSDSVKDKSADSRQANDLMVLADKDRIVQVMVNLLSNAVKFSTAGSTVQVESHILEGDSDNSGKKAVVKVIDKGRGIPADYMDTLFERYKQVKKADGARKKGTGLGLAICKAIVESHGGRIWVESEEGRGSVFSFSLQLADS